MTKDRLTYSFIIGSLKLVAFLPLWALYLLSDFISFVLHRIVRYRREIVRINLQNSFPEKSKAELLKIENQFYSYLCDCFIETIKLLHISDKQLKRRVKLCNTDVVKKIAAEKHPIILFMGHYANWEWIPSLTLSLKEPKIMGALYKPLHDKVMDKVMLHIRSRFRSKCIPIRSAYRNLLELKSTGDSFMIGFIADQRPVGVPLKHWTTFMNQPTAYVAGGETIGDRVGAKYVYLDMERVKRGYYTLTFKTMEIASDDGEEYPYTRQFFNMLEQTIRRNPPYWLWSHNRWKSNRP